MSTYELKTHRAEKKYSNSHFFILNKGLNSGKPSTDEEKNTLFHLSMMLQIGGFYRSYLKGSVIPFISIDDCRNTLNKALNSSKNIDFEFKKHIKAVAEISKKENELKSIINKMADLKVAYIKSCFVRK